MSQETTLPIAVVPILVLYIDGKPKAKFNGKKNYGSVQEFLETFLNSAMGAERGGRSMGPSGARGGFASAAPSAGRGHQGQQKTWAPEIGVAPSMKGILKNYQNPNMIDDDDDPTLLVPDTITPHNAPWEADIFKDE